MSIFKAQIDHCNTINVLSDNFFNDIRPLSYVASQANDDVLYYHQAMQSEDSDDFRKAMAKETSSFKQEKAFEIMPIGSKPKEKSLIPFMWSFKRKRNPMGNLIKHETRLCMHGGRQVKGIRLLEHL